MKAEFPIIRSEKSNSVIRWGRHTEGRYFYLNRYFFILIDVCWSEVPSKPVVLQFTFYFDYTPCRLLQLKELTVSLQKVFLKQLDRVTAGLCKEKSVPASTMGQLCKIIRKNLPLKVSTVVSYSLELFRGVVESDQIRINTYFPFIAKKK